MTRAKVCVWVVGFVFAFAACARGLFAQCPPGWQSGDAFPGVNGVVRAVLKLPDGRVVIGGNFTVAGGTFAAGVAVWDGVAWQALGTEPLSDGTGSGGVGTVYALGLLPNGDLVAGGNFAMVGSTTVNYVARWDGSAWRAIGSGVGNWVRAIAVMPNGDLVVGGGGLFPGGPSSYSCVGRWNGTSWQSVGGAVMNVGANVYSLLPLSDGRLLVGGSMTVTLPGGGSVNGLAVWNGTAWSALGAGATTGSVYSIVLSHAGEVTIGGGFGQVGGVTARGVARWNGTVWTGFGNSFQSGAVNQVACLSNGDIVAVGGFYEAGAGGTLAAAARWNGSAWTPMGGGLRNGLVFGRIGYGVVVDNNSNVVVGGDFALADGKDASCVASWNGVAWSALPAAGVGTTAAARMRAIAVGPDGSVYGAGDFVQGPLPYRGGVFKRTGSGWQQVGGELTGSENGGLVRAVTVLPNGEVVVGGGFTNAGGTPVNYMARWDGVAWRAIGPGVNGPVDSVAVTPDGTLYGSGYFSRTIDGVTTIGANASWDGSAWTPLPPSMGMSMSRSKLAVASNGDLLVFDGRLGRWNGSSWTDCGYPVPVLYSPRSTALAVGSNGDVFASVWCTNSGSPQQVARVCRWSGGAWSQVGGDFTYSSIPQVSALSVLADGDVIASGVFTAAGGVPARGAARWNGAAWTEFEGGFGYSPSVAASPWASAVLPNGDLVVGGSFVSAGSDVSAHFASYSMGGGGITVVQQPRVAFSCTGGDAELSVAATCSDPISYRWSRNGQPLDLVTHPSAGTAVLTFSDASSADAGEYRCEMTARCATVLSSPATLFVDAADMGQAGGVPGRDGSYDNNDFIVFISHFFDLDPRADMGRSGGELGSDGQFDNNDFIAFIDAFFIGC